MLSLEFALSIIALIIIFLTFALTIAAILVGDKNTKVEARKLFQVIVTKLIGRFPW
jgi:hypothetical protein